MDRSNADATGISYLHLRELQDSTVPAQQQPPFRGTSEVVREHCVTGFKEPVNQQSGSAIGLSDPHVTVSRIMYCSGARKPVRCCYESALSQTLDRSPVPTLLRVHRRSIQSNLHLADSPMWPSMSHGETDFTGHTMKPRWCICVIFCY